MRLLEMLGTARGKGLLSSDVSAALGIAPRNFYYVIKVGVILYFRTFTTSWRSVILYYRCTALLKQLRMLIIFTGFAAWSASLTWECP